MEKRGLNCCRDWNKVPANARHCRVISVIAGRCVDENCTWNTDRAGDKCLYENRGVKLADGKYRIYLQSGPVEAYCELDAIAIACHSCDINKDCYKLPAVVKRLKEVRHA